MANRLAMDKVQAVKSLEAAGLSERRIARTLCISRKAVRRHLARDPSKGTKAPTGEAPTGSGGAKDTKAPTGSRVGESPPIEASRSLCRSYLEAILTKLQQGLTAQRIYQDLRDEQGFPGKYPSVRRGVQRRRDPSPATPSQVSTVPPLQNCFTLAASTRLIYDDEERGQCIAEWHRRGYDTPRGGCEHYDLHHVLPREYGGTHDFWNLVPVERITHRTQFDTFWQPFIGL